MTGIFTYILLILMANVGKYTSPMDPMGMSREKKLLTFHCIGCSHYIGRVEVSYSQVDTMLEFFWHGHQQQIRIVWYTGSLGEILTGFNKMGVKIVG